MNELIPYEEALFNIQYEIDMTEHSIMTDKIKLRTIRQLQQDVLAMTAEQWIAEQKKGLNNG